MDKLKGGGFQKILSIVGRLIPGLRLKTTIYLKLIYGPRKFFRTYTSGFYRIDHIYDVMKEFSNQFEGKFSVIEFGVADGYAFTKKLYAAEYLGVSDRFRFHGFDTFEGLPEIDDDVDSSLVAGDSWEEGTYKGRQEELQAHCAERYDNFELHKGLFEDTLTQEFLDTLEEYKPALIWIDCDLYSSTKSIFERLLPYIPTGCVIYFDDIYYNYSSRFTGEMRAVHEINSGKFGENVELVPDTALSWDSNRLYRMINMDAKTKHVLRKTRTDGIRFRADDSPFP
ncbi:TylF/MycF family methyltransferase [Ruegeria sp. 2012CJ41-6]|uniref:TylF/MycF family methyltransferase n=1 Tax=Ruegeria spongiae TaxID=2942209 RepID=A0ABT0Q629_9RHOB|nr:TylF/MycF/NovP-related O-methyltransferase [Ruegeria spongiae]MCL6285270.1 TylF/MycF family methyltransferase [Ruegeria spongiae]